LPATDGADSYIYSESVKIGGDNVAHQLTKPNPYLALEYLQKAERHASTRFFHKDEDIRAYLRNISARIKQLTQYIDKTKEDLKRLQGKRDNAALYAPLVEGHRADVGAWERELLMQKSLLEEYAKKEKPINSAVMETTVKAILQSYGVTAPTRSQKKKMLLAITEGIDVDEALERLKLSDGKMKKYGEQCRGVNHAPVEVHTDPNTNEKRILSIVHPNGERIYLDATGKNILFVANVWGAIHYHYEAASNVLTDYSTFKTKEKLMRWELEQRVDQTEQRLRADVALAYSQLDAQQPVKVPARMDYPQD